MFKKFLNKKQKVSRNWVEELQRSITDKVLTDMGDRPLTQIHKDSFLVLFAEEKTKLADQRIEFYREQIKLLQNNPKTVYRNPDSFMMKQQKLEMDLDKIMALTNVLTRQYGQTATNAGTKSPWDDIDQGRIKEAIFEIIKKL